MEKSIAIVANGAFSLHNFRGPLIKEMVKRGHKVYALAPDHCVDSRRIISGLGAEPVDIFMNRVGVNPVAELKSLYSIYSVLRAIRPDIVFSYFLKPVIYSTLMGYLAGVPSRFALIAGLGITFADDAKQGGQSGVRKLVVRGVVKLLLRKTFKAAQRVFFQNGDDVQLLRDEGLIDRQKIVRINGTGVDLAHFAPAPMVNEPVTFLLVARLLRAKGIEYFAEAAALVRQEHPNARFILVGGLDPNPDGLPRETVDRWVADGILEWAGQVSDVRPWIRESSVFVLPSFYREGVPRSIQEAMAMGRPIITTDWTGCRETVIENVNGFLIPINDTDALRKKMLLFIEDSTRLEAMGRKSLEIAKLKYDVEAINNEILNGLDIGPTPE